MSFNYDELDASSSTKHALYFILSGMCQVGVVGAQFSAGDTLGFRGIPKLHEGGVGGEGADEKDTGVGGGGRGGKTGGQRPKGGRKNSPGGEEGEREGKRRATKYMRWCKETSVVFSLNSSYRVYFYPTQDEHLWRYDQRSPGRVRC